jgi:outer membrane protein TolC
MISPSVYPRLLRIGLTWLGLGLGASRLAAADPLPTPMPEQLLPELKVILEQAMQQSPQMVLRNIDLATSEANYLLTRSAMLPGVSASASYNISGAAVSSDTNVSSTASGLYYSLNFSQSVFRWGTLKAQTDAARIQQDISRKNYAEAYRSLALSLRSQYLLLMGKKVAWINTQFARQQLAAALALEEDKLRNGQTSENQVMQLRLQTEEVSLMVERAAEDLAMSKRFFIRQAGLAELADERIPTGIPALAFQPAAASAMLQKFLGHDWEDNLNVQINRNLVKVADLNYKVAKYRLYPMVSIAAGISQSNSTNAAPDSVSQVSVLSQYAGLSVGWSIFDGFATKGAKISALANKRIYERQLQTLTDQLMDQAMSQERQVGFAYRAMGLAQARAALSESALRTMEEDAQRGIVSRAAVTAALGAHNQARHALLNQQADFLSRWSEFVSTVGHDPVLQSLPAR